jgi:hypothetical protein
MSGRNVDYFYDQVVRIKVSGCSGREYEPGNLREALPNRSYVIPGVTTFTYSDAALVGRVILAEPGPAFAYAGDDVRVPVAFDDPRAAERAFEVRVAVDEWFGHGQPADAVSFRMGAMGARDLDRYLDGLNRLGRVTVSRVGGAEVGRPQRCRIAHCQTMPTASMKRSTASSQGHHLGLTPPPKASEVSRCDGCPPSAPS